MEFDKQRFFQSLLDMPAEQPLLETPEHSDYLQKQVFDKLAADQPIDLTDLDWDAFELRHVIPNGLDTQHGRIHYGWLCGVNAILHNIPAANLSEKRFF